jgi:sec-independent protein translocase protein TatA
MSMGPFELVIVLVLVLVLFGAGKLPEVLGQFGQAIRAFREAQRDPPPMEVTEVSVPPVTRRPPNLEE